MSQGLVVGLAVVLLLVLIGLRAPIFVALSWRAIAGLLGLCGLTGLEQIPTALVDQLQNFSLVAAPMYILMGEILSVSGLGQDLFGRAPLARGSPGAWAPRRSAPRPSSGRCPG